MMDPLTFLGVSEIVSSDLGALTKFQNSILNSSKVTPMMSKAGGAEFLDHPEERIALMLKREMRKEN